MKSFHFQTIPSTQLYLKENFTELSQHFGAHLLVSTEFQTEGIGRGGHTWDTWQKGLFFSFTLEPLEKLTLTSLEMSVLTAIFFEQKFQANIQIKWPNDLINSKREKCGGLLLHSISKDYLICGIGINLYPGEKPISKYKIPAGPLFEKASNQNFQNEQSELPLEIYKFILSNRLTEQEIVLEWNRRCVHLNEEVEIIEDNVEPLHGIFLGIGNSGEALLQIGQSQNIKKIFSGSLKLKI